MNDDDTHSTAGRFIAAALLTVCTLGFGLAGLCGAAFTAIGLASLSDSSNPYASAALVIAVPSLLIGGGLAWVCGRALYKRSQRSDA
jgi:hypothetical protein